jgi:hypothetical protein
MALKVRNKIFLNIPKVYIMVHAKLLILIDWVPLTIQCLVEEVSLPLVLGLISNQCMADLDVFLMIILPPKMGAHICLINRVGSLTPISN